MIVILSNNDLIGSKIISFFTKEGKKVINTPSHVSILFCSRIILEAVFFAGVRLNYFRFFQSKNRIIAAFKYVGNKYEGKKDNEIYAEICDSFYGQSYDFIGVLWFIVQIVKKWLFNKPIKRVNKWQRQNKQFCVEMLEPILGKDLSSLDPESTLKLLRKHPDFMEIKAGDL
jgi:hypothetical protein